MKTLFWTAVVVAIGVYVWGRLTKAGSVGGTITFGPISIKAAESATFQGPDIDPVTGAYLAPGAQPGTSSFPVQPIAS